MFLISMRSSFSFSKPAMATTSEATSRALLDDDASDVDDPYKYIRHTCSPFLTRQTHEHHKGVGK